MRIRPSAMLLVLALSTRPLAAQPLTFERDDHPSTLSGRGIATADFNRDGWIDLVTAHHDPDGVSVLLNRGRAGGYTSSFISLPGGPFGVTTGDLNKDGKPDIAVANPDANLINVLYGFGDGTFRPPLNVGGWFNPRGLTIADMDRDTNPDIVFTAYNNRSVVIYFGDGAQSFIHRQAATPTVGFNPQGVAVADFNVDGWPDIVAANSASAGLTILYHTPGVMTFTPRELAVQAQNVVTVGDFDGDGRPDIAAASTATSDVTVVLNKRTGMTTATYASGGGSTRGIAAADLNRDGAVDLVTANRGTSTVEVLFNNGNGTFAAAVGFAAGTGSRDVATGDFDNDGRVDVASANEYVAAATVLSNTTAFPRSGFSFHREVLGANSGISNGSAAGFADFNLDGRLDALIAAGREITLFVTGGGGVTIGGSQVGGVAAALVNGDANPDVISLERGSFSTDRTRIMVYLGSGTGGFTGSRTTQTSLIATRFDTGDLDGDGRLDVVLMGGTQEGFGTQQIQVFLGRDGTFVPGNSVALPRTVSNVALGDLDRDGDLDVVGHENAISSDTSRVLWWMNDGTGVLGPMHSAAADEMELFSGISLGDLNHDGYLDFTGGGLPRDFVQGGKVAVLLGGPDGFQTATYLPTREPVLQTTVADVTLDGNADIVGGSGVLFAGNGDGTFDAQLFAYSIRDIHVIDFNRDGLPDLGGPYADGAIQVLINDRRDTNRAPVLDLTNDFTIAYSRQFGDAEFDLFAEASDPDLHGLTFKWTMPDGSTVDTGTFPGMTLRPMSPGQHRFTVEASDGRGATATDTVVVTVTNEKEINLHVGSDSSITFATGNWSAVDDASAASGRALRDVNNGAAKVTTPLANPASYSEVSFVADPTQTYKLWVRLKAEGNGTSNDSVWLQFTGAVDASGRTFEPGSTSGIEVVLEECSGCGISGWGWRDEAWGQRDAIGSVTLRFPEGGFQRLRMQTREDGVSVDQIVLSAEKYRTTRPGLVKNDSTIVLPKSIY